MPVTHTELSQQYLTIDGDNITVSCSTSTGSRKTTMFIEGLDEQTALKVADIEQICEISRNLQDEALLLRAARKERAES